MLQPKSKKIICMKVHSITSGTKLVLIYIYFFFGKNSSTCRSYSVSFRYRGRQHWTYLHKKVAFPFSILGHMAHAFSSFSEEWVKRSQGQLKRHLASDATCSAPWQVRYLCFIITITIPRHRYFLHFYRWGKKWVSEGLTIWLMLRLV